MNYASPREMFADNARLIDGNPLAHCWRTLTTTDLLVMEDELGRRPHGGDLARAPLTPGQSYFVSDWLARALVRQGEIVEHLEEYPGWYVWGRCDNDDMPYLDPCIEAAFGTLDCAAA